MRSVTDDGSDPATAEIVPLGAPYETSVLVIEAPGEDLLFVRGSYHGHRRRAALWCLPSVRLRAGDDPVLAAARGCADITGHWPSRHFLTAHYREIAGVGETADRPAADGGATGPANDLDVASANAQADR